MIWSEEELKLIRRELHKIPEVGLEEIKTHRFLLEQIGRFSQDFLEVKTWETAIIVKVKGSVGTKTFGWRTDIDGLPIAEEVESDFVSTHEGKMHACGHDFHMTIALGLLQRLSERQPINNVVFLFQPAEENECGGKLVYDSGAMDEWMPEEIYALHVQPKLPVGHVSTKKGIFFAGCCEVRAHFKGKSGHAAYPHLANDMIVAVAQFVQQCQTIVSRNVNPLESAVISFGSLQAGTATNVITGDAKILGTIRSFSNEINELTQKRIREIADGIALSFNCKVDLVLDQKGYVPVINDDRTTQKLIDFMMDSPIITCNEAEVAMTGEDFGYLLSKISGTMFWLGVDSPFDLHHSQFEPKEEALKVAVDFLDSFFSQLN